MIERGAPNRERSDTWLAGILMLVALLAAVLVMQAVIITRVTPEHAGEIEASERVAIPMLAPTLVADLKFDRCGPVLCRGGFD